MNNVVYPAIPANTAFDNSAVHFAHSSGVNAVELETMAQVIARLARDHSTVAPVSVLGDLAEFVELGYVEMDPTTAGTALVTLKVPGALLSTYFWAVWVPRHLYTCALKVALIPALRETGPEQLCTVVFRIPGTREDARQFTAALAAQYAGDAPEIVAIQAGNALAQEGV